MTPHLPLTVLVRLFALYWAVSGVFGSLVGLGLFMETYHFNLRHIASQSQVFIMPVFYVSLAFCSWIFAPKIALFLMSGVDSEFRLPQTSPESLYTLGLLMLGGYFFLNNLGTAFTVVSYIIAARGEGRQFGSETSKWVVEMSRVVAPCMAGLILAIFAQKLARKLVRSGQAVVQTGE